MEQCSSGHGARRCQQRRSIKTSCRCHQGRFAVLDGKADISLSRTFWNLAFGKLDMGRDSIGKVSTLWITGHHESYYLYEQLGSFGVGWTTNSNITVQQESYYIRHKVKLHFLLREQISRLISSDRPLAFRMRMVLQVLHWDFEVGFTLAHNL